MILKVQGLLLWQALNWVSKLMQTRYFSIFLLLVLVGTGYAQRPEAPKASPYTITTTYEKNKKKYPFITPIENLVSDSIHSYENITYRFTTTDTLQLDVYTPNKKGKYPAVVLIHGGGWISGSRENQRTMGQYLAKNGIIGVPVSYTLADHAPYPAPVIDIKTAIQWLRKHADTYGIDTDNIAILGTSAGAQLATLVGVTPNSEVFKTDTSTSDAVQAIINVDGVVSFIHPEAEEGTYAAYFLGGTKAGQPDLWKQASPLEYVGKNTPPTLFINSSQARFHAGRDAMITKLNQFGIYNEVHTLEGSPHSFWLLHPWFKPTVAFTVAFLKTL